MAKNPLDAQAERISRARELVEAGAYLVTPGAVLVFSDAPGVAGHTVSHGQCSCPDAAVGWAARNLDGRCKHFWVAALLRHRPADVQVAA